MPGAQPRKSFQTRMASTARRGAYAPAGVPGVHRVPRRTRNAVVASEPRGVASPISFTPVYWYDAADADASSWPSHEGHGLTLTATSGSGTIVPAALNGHQGVQVSGGFMRYGVNQTPHLFDNGITILVVALEGSSDSAFVNIFSFSGDPTQYQDAEHPTTFEVIYTDDTNSTVHHFFPHTRVSGDPVAAVYGVDGSGVPFARINGADLSPSSTSGSAGATAQAVDSMQIGLFSTLTYLEVMAFDTGDSGIASARSFLSSKYAISV